MKGPTETEEGSGAVIDRRAEGLLMRAQPSREAEQISRRMVDVQVVNGTLLLGADPSWAGAINTVLIKKGVRVNELRSVSDISSSEECGSGRSARSLCQKERFVRCTRLQHMPSFAWEEAGSSKQWAMAMPSAS